MPRTTDEQRLNAAVVAMEPAVAARVLAALRAIRDLVSEEELARILAMRDAVALHDLLGRLPNALRPAVVALQRAFEAGARAGLAAVPNVTIGFNAVDPASVAFAHASSSRLVREVTEETRSAIRRVIGRMFSDGIPPRDAAKLIKPLIGLTSKQAAAVLKRVEQLVAQGVSRRSALAQGKRYAELLLKRRALTIARTETIRSASQGQMASWRTATAQGLLRPGAHKVWITTPDDRLCRFCAPMDGQAVPLDETFQSAFTRVSGPPLHPNCRCAIALAPAVAVGAGRRAA